MFHVSETPTYGKAEARAMPAANKKKRVLPARIARSVLAAALGWGSGGGWWAFLVRFPSDSVMTR